MRKRPNNAVRLDEAVTQVVGRLGHLTTGELCRRVPYTFGDTVSNREIFRSVKRLVEKGVLVPNEAPLRSCLREYSLRRTT